jgi:NAD(P)-dependent dehydrogenase (short-subunit alcohol dehydrogenase family)
LNTFILDDPKQRQWIESRIPMGRVGQVSDLLGAVIFLASAASDFITGHVLYVDGGWTAA